MFECLLWSWRRADAAKSHAELCPDAVVVRLAVCQVVSKTDSPSLIIEPLCSKIGQVLLLLLWYRLVLKISPEQREQDAENVNIATALSTEIIRG